ncbi:MAG TPA: hypothetical protein VN578_24965 [Candidatus Binatia bacterium]|jgi:hypothetical protein|nr:hypothetical protein [Candidatus Binatia bacterium]
MKETEGMKAGTRKNGGCCVMSRDWAVMAGTVVVLAAWAGALRAGTLYVPNFSFESPATSFADPRVDSWQKPTQPGTFDTNIFGAWDNLAGVFLNAPSTNADHIDNADGNQLAYIFAYPQVALFQDFNSTDWSNAVPTHAFNAKFEAGKSYHLAVGLTSSREEPLTPGSTLQLMLYYRDDASNMVTVAATTVTYDTNLFTNITHLVDFQVNVPAVKTNDAWAAKNIGIQFQSTVAPNLIGGVWDLDKVRLTETIDIPNFSFESPATAFADPRVDSWQKPPQPDTFDTNIFGAWDNLAGVFLNAPSTNIDHIDNADGNQLAYLFAYPQVALFQDFNSTDWSNAAATHAFNARFKAGKSYTLTIGLVSSREEPLTPGSTLQLSLYYRDGSSNMVTVAATTVAYDTNIFTNITHLIDFRATVPEVKASDPWAGQNIGIQFLSTVAPNLIGGVWDLDNVRLTEVVATALNNPGLTNGQFNFTLQSEPGLPFEVLAGTNVTQPATNWASIATFTNVTGTFGFTDPATNLKQRFYRAHQLR